MSFAEYQRDARFAAGIAAKKPFQVLLQVTNRCNMRCSFCDFWPNGVAPKLELQTVDFQKLARDLADIGTFLVSIEGGRLRQPQPASDLPSGLPELAHLPPLPEPALPDASRAWGIVVAGIGGTGVITIGQVLGMAAHLEGRGVVTQEAAGLAQKGGATWSHVQIADRPEAIFTTKVGTAEADLVMGCDPIVTALPATLAVMRAGRTHVALNTHHTPTAAAMAQPDWHYPGAQCDHVLADAVGSDPDAIARLDTVTLAEKLLGDAIYANPMMLGFAWQKGWVPLSLQALTRAIELNAVQVERNLQAFTWGRHAAHDPARMARLLTPAIGA